MMQSEDWVPVAVGLLRQNEQVLLAKRPAHVHQGGKWEFPGGKIKPGESVLQALHRELQEELAIIPRNVWPKIRIPYAYPDKNVLLDVWEVDTWQGQPSGQEGQAIQWWPMDALPTLDLPAANRGIVCAARLPTQYAITPQWHGPWSGLLAELEQTLQEGVQLVQFRQPQRQHEAGYAAVVREATALCHQYQARLLVNQNWALAMLADGIHLPASSLNTTPPADFPAHLWLGASCHNAAEIKAAKRLGVDFAVVSPLHPTRSHPQAHPLGWQAFFTLTEQADFPIYALGGMRKQHLDLAYAHGAQGIAAIEGLWACTRDATA